MAEWYTDCVYIILLPFQVKAISELHLCEKNSKLLLFHLTFFWNRLKIREILLTVIAEQDSDCSSSDDDLEMLLIDSFFPPKRVIGYRLNWRDVGEDDFENLFRWLRVST